LPFHVELAGPIAAHYLLEASFLEDNFLLAFGYLRCRRVTA
jgi:hypothetical protein